MAQGWARRQRDGLGRTIRLSRGHGIALCIRRRVLFGGRLRVPLFDSACAREDDQQSDGEQWYWPHASSAGVEQIYRVRQKCHARPQEQQTEDERPWVERVPLHGFPFPGDDLGPWRLEEDCFSGRVVPGA